jgi:hypothetical protein
MAFYPPPAPELGPVKSELNSVEVWIDPMPFPLCILLLLGNPAGSCSVHDPAEYYNVVFSSATYAQAQIWLLEDECKPVAGRLSSSELWTGQYNQLGKELTIRLEQTAEWSGCIVK